jgi:hypothetical protein
MALGLALQWPWGSQDRQGKCRGIAGAMREVLQSKTAGHRLSSTGPEAPERHSDTVAL